MKRLLLTCFLVLVSSVALVEVVVRPGGELPDVRSDGSWYLSQKANLENSLDHAAPGSGRAFKIQSKLARLESWRADEPRMGAPEEFARILNEMRIPADRTTAEYKPGYLFREVEKARQFAAPQAKSVAWQSRGPGNVAGRARAIVVDPDDPTGDTWFIASVGGGVWQTANAGGSWQQLMDDQPLLAVQSLAMAASNTSIMYAGTGESYFNVDTMNGNGVLRTLDKGATWSPLPSTVDDPRFNNVSRIIVSPTDPDLVLVATTVGRYMVDVNPATHIFRSTDGGTTWTEVFTQPYDGGTERARVQQLIADPTDFDVMYASVNANGILKSTDAGLTWTYMNSGITDFTGRFEVAISPVNSNYIYASAQGASSSLLWVSWNAGNTWSAMANTGGTDAWLGSQGWYDNTIICHPTDVRIVYVGGPQLYSLTINIVGGSSYSAVALASYGFPHPDHHMLAIVEPAGGGWYLLGTNDGGVTRTTSEVSGFTMPIDGMVTTQFYGVDKRPGASAYIGGMQDNGTWQSPLNPVANDFWDFRIGGDGYETSWNFDDSQKIMGGYQFNGLQRSLDGGVSWGSATFGMTDTGAGNAPFITKIASSWQRPDDVFVVGVQGVWRSVDFGASWNLAAIDPAQWGGISSFHDVRVSRADQDIIWAGSRMDSNGDVMVSTNAGATFNPTNDFTDVVMGGISGLATHPTEPNTAYALFSFAERPKILKTTDLGVTWADLSGFGTGSVSTNGFPDVAVYDLLVWPNDPQHIWVGTEIGLLESVDGGLNWALVNNGLPSVGIWFLKAVEDEIIVATHGRGVWTTTVPALMDGMVFNPLFESMAQVPGGDLDLQFNLRSVYDSTQIWIDGSLLETVASNIKLQPHQVSVPVLAAGPIPAFARSFVGGQIFESTTKQVSAYPMAEPVYTYNNALDDSGDFPFANDGFAQSVPVGFSSPALHTVHDYVNSVSYTAVMLVPIMVSADTDLIFDEIAIIEPGEPGTVFGDGSFWDYVVVEGSTNGQTWQTIGTGWDARDDASWLSAYNAGQDGTEAMYRTRTLSLSDVFAPHTAILLRWRLVADSAVTGWGWAVDNIVVSPLVPVAVNEIPRAVTLGQNYPNPFNPTTTISFTLPQTGRAKLQVYDTRGRLVRTLIDGPRSAGAQSEIWNGRDDAGRGVASGVYMYRLTSGDVVQQRKMMLVK